MMNSITSNLYLSGMWRKHPFYFDNYFFYWYALNEVERRGMESFKRSIIKQHKEVLPDGIYTPKVIKKSKKSILEQEKQKEFEKEIDEYLSTNHSS